MKVVPKEDSFADFQCPACLCWIDEHQSIRDPYSPSSVDGRTDVPYPCPGCGKQLLVSAAVTVTFTARLADKA